METIKKNLQSLISNYANNNIADYIYTYDSDERVNLETLKDFINTNSNYYVSDKKNENIEIDENNVIKNITSTDKNLSFNEKVKTKGRPKKPDVDKLMSSIMILVEKYVDKEKEKIEVIIKEKFSLIIRSDEEDIKRDDKSLKEEDIKNEEKDLSHISNALISAVNGNIIENIDEIQKSIKEISEKQQENVHIEVNEIMIKGEKYLIDENNNIYDFENHDILGCFDRKSAIIKYIE
jgi:hypothetical protein